MRSVRIRRRLLLWILPVLLAAFGVLALAYFRGAARLSEARNYLLLGDAEAAGKSLAELAGSPLHGAQARAGLRVAKALGARNGDFDGGFDSASADTAPFPLAVLARRAFEEGHFEAAVALIDLAAADGRPIVRLVRAAALIEQGRPHDLELDGDAGVSALPPVRLARHVRHHLETKTPEDGSLVLRDRTGRRLGHLDPDDSFAIAPGIRAEWIPRTVAEVIGNHRGAASLRLSLDLELSELALEAFGSYRGSIVILEARSGEILAAVSDRKTFRTGATPAFEEFREPASISKLVTTTAALRAGLDPNAEIARMTCTGHREYDGKPLYCPYVAGRLRGLDRALAVSCNVAFADLAVMVGRRRLLEELRLYGFDGSTGPFPGGRVLQPRGDERQLADLAIGLEATDVTPLHAALLAAVMANGGVMPVPTLLHAEDGRLGFHPRRLPPAPGRQVVEPEWLPQILSAMRRVAEGGTARGVAPPGFPVAMKTGTASHPRWGFHVNYIGTGPMPDARIAFCVRITHQRTSRRVRDAATVVTRRLLRALGRVAEQRGWLGEPGEASRDRIHRLARGESRGSSAKPLRVETPPELRRHPRTGAFGTSGQTVPDRREGVIGEVAPGARHEPQERPERGPGRPQAPQNVNETPRAEQHGAVRRQDDQGVRQFPASLRGHLGLERRPGERREAERFARSVAPCHEAHGPVAHAARAVVEDAFRGRGLELGAHQGILAPLREPRIEDR